MLATVAGDSIVLLFSHVILLLVITSCWQELVLHGGAAGVIGVWRRRPMTAWMVQWQ